MNSAVRLDADLAANPRAAEDNLATALVIVLEPLVRRIVREEIERAKLQWRWRSVRQTAELLDLSEAAVRARCERGQLPCKKLDGRLFIDLHALDYRMQELP